MASSPLYDTADWLRRQNQFFADALGPMRRDVAEMQALVGQSTSQLVSYNPWRRDPARPGSARSDVPAAKRKRRRKEEAADGFVPKSRMRSGRMERAAFMDLETTILAYFEVVRAAGSGPMSLRAIEADIVQTLGVHWSHQAIRDARAYKTQKLAWDNELEERRKAAALEIGAARPHRRGKSCADDDRGGGGLELSAHKPGRQAQAWREDEDDQLQDTVLKQIKVDPQLLSDLTQYDADLKALSEDDRNARIRKLLADSAKRVASRSSGDRPAL